MTRKLLQTTLCLLLAASFPAFADHDRNKKVRESVEVANLYEFGSEALTNGATILIRDYRNQVVHAEIMSNSLVPEHAYSIWAVVFNFPEFCNEPWACNSGDLLALGGDPRVKSSVFWAGGILADAMGSGNTSLRLIPGRTKRELFPAPDKTTDTGLRRLRRAEIHFVLRSHDLAGVAGSVADQIGTATLACPEPMGCSNRFFSVHRAVMP